MNLKRLFCKHLYLSTNSKFIRQEEYVSNLGGRIEIEYYDIFIDKQRCVKCGKLLQTERHKRSHKWI